jgi:DNA-binding beta-propeller fold protein YncE
MPSSAARGARLPRFAVLVGCLLVAACDESNSGKPAPTNELFFPSGILLDPRAHADGVAPRWLFVANGNNDLTYSTGSVIAIDLDAFYRAWTADPATMKVDPYCDDDDDPDDPNDFRCVLNLGSDIVVPEDDPDGRPDRPCRRLALSPGVVECDERAFVESSVRVGDFATLLTSSCETPPKEEDDTGTGSESGSESGSDTGDTEGAPQEQEDPTQRCQHSRIWLPVRGEPSVTYIDLLDDDEDGRPELSCLDAEAKLLQDEALALTQAAGKRPSLDEIDLRRCGREHRLTRRRNNSDFPEIDREPFNMVVSPSFRYGYVAHADSETLSIIALDGYSTTDEPGRPAIIDSAPMFADQGGFTGGFGIAERPCRDGNAPSLTNGCSRPLVYGSFRYLRALVSFTVQAAELDDPSKCLGPNDEPGAPGKINCDPLVRSRQVLFPGGLDPQSTQFRPVLGDMAFGDDAGNELYVVQTAPGALLKLDTSLGPDGEPFDTPSAPPIELCEEPTRMKLYRDGGQRIAVISCFRAALVYFVDLDAFRVVGIVDTGTGPYEVEVDEERDVVYVGNSLERSISVFDVARDRTTRFQEIARIGLQEPFMR